MGRNRAASAAARQENFLVRWRKTRRARRESRLLVKEARRILRKYRQRIEPKLTDEVKQAITAVEDARREGGYRRLRDKAEKLEDLLEKRLAFGRKSALREYTESIGIAVIIALILRAFVVEAFKIPSGSMIPTLKIGDHIFVNKYTYGLRIPLTDIRFFDRMPDHGDVVVFIYPVEPDKDFIKRVIAVGGDRVRVEDDVVYVNDKALPRRELSIPCKFVDAEEDTEHYTIEPCVAFQEHHGEHTYRVIQDPAAPDFLQSKTMEEVRVPPGHIFVMGDNRDNSHDGRAWGFVPLTNVKGRAMIIWWSSGRPEGVRWGRFFHRVHATPDSKRIVP